MSGAFPRAARLVAASTSVYSVLLLLYPRPFRERFAEPMALAFHDACRATARAGGAPALARLWLATLGDLLVSALAEHSQHLKEEPVMEQHSLSRAAGLAGLIGGVLLLFYGAIGLLTLVNVVMGDQTIYNRALFDTRSALFLPISWAPTLVAPLAWLCAIVVLWALTVWLAPRSGWGVWLVGGVAMLGALMCFVGTFSQVIGGWNSWYYGHDMSYTYQSLLAGDPTPYLASLDLFGRMLLGVGLLALVVVAWRSASKGLLIIPLILGAVALLPHLFLYLAGPAAILRNVPIGTRYGGQVLWTPFSLPFPAGLQLNVALLAVDALFALVWGLGLLALGSGFLRRGAAAVAHPAPALA